MRDYLNDYIRNYRLQGLEAIEVIRQKHNAMIARLENRILYRIKPKITRRVPGRAPLESYMTYNVTLKNIAWSHPDFIERQAIIIHNFYLLERKDYTICKKKKS